VANEVTRMGGDVVRLNTDGYGNKYELGWDSEQGGRILADGRWSHVAEIGAVYNRRPSVAEVPLTDRDFGVHESWYFARSLLLESSAKWLNHPAAVDVAENKLRQLRVAKEAGFMVPDSVLTSDPAEAARFCANRGVVCKPAFAGIVGGAKQKRVVYAWRVPERQQSLGFESIRLSPTFLQEEVVKSADIRLTVVGKSLSCVKIVSPAGVLDWRQEVTGTRLKYDRVVAPKEIREAAHKLMAALNISFGALDFAVDQHGEWWFLEINPSGQWEWLDVVAGTQIATEIAQWLLSMEEK